MFIASGLVPILSQGNNGLLFIIIFKVIGWKKPLQKKMTEKKISSQFVFDQRSSEYMYSTVLTFF